MVLEQRARAELGLECVALVDEPGQVAPDGPDVVVARQEVAPVTVHVDRSLVPQYFEPGRGIIVIGGRQSEEIEIGERRTLHGAGGLVCHGFALPDDFGILVLSLSGEDG